MAVKTKEAKVKTEKVYLTRDEDDNHIYVWRKPAHGVWSPKQLKDCETINWQREGRSLENVDIYLAPYFKKKFGFTIRKKTKRCCHLPYDLLHNEDYKLFSDDPDRKK